MTVPAWPSARYKRHSLRYGDHRSPSARLVVREILNMQCFKVSYSHLVEFLLGNNTTTYTDVNRKTATTTRRFSSEGVFLNVEAMLLNESLALPWEDSFVVRAVSGGGRRSRPRSHSKVTSNCENRDT